MSWLSKDAEKEIKQEVAVTVSNFLENYTRPEPRLLGLITQADLKKELGIEYQTIRRWEENGLKRYQAPVEDTRKVFYKINELLQFLGAQ
ncbi:hypothetical protein [Streptococcus parauberis]|uniref:hypothetical protein n=1 Tax=Streptococcus parauberis TaxID=1348 RepID=UPI0002BB8FA0|nr:hypothetical protein [Streptococcus parauberis]QBX09905.1 hypothetical protein JavanS397_0007 [Streptococcus satellite phage Javan397]EMF48554.1 hypothetical protein SPJ2_1767 [Streptococcus parauberis KRS-02109]UWM86750.1 XRE family transcriptional regulator [Streptococcus parauberis]UWM88722.1 XRE family transcriptional regulator [Streptococcus parauberis]WEM59503.1 XRE family transcriptional regulator [Streptococcus parauberis]